MNNKQHCKNAFWLTLLLFSSACQLALAAASPPDPRAVVRKAADSVLAEITAHKAELDADSSRIYPMLEHVIAPHFDFSRMTQSAMGRFWRQTEPEQRDRLTEAFKALLIRTYAAALLNYTGQTIEYLPAHPSAQGKRVKIPTRISAADGPPIPVDYLLNWDADLSQWKVYDVVIDGVSLVTTYRSSFNRLIREGARQEADPAKRMQAGVEHLIASIKQKNTATSKKADG